MFRSLTRFAPRAAAAAMGRPATPAFDIYDVRDDPAQGRHLRCSYNDDARVVNVTVFPQFGPRKEDVNDATPQFDSSRRTTLRLRMNEVADVLAVLKGAQETAAIKSKRFDVKASVVGEEFVLAGSLSRTMGADNAEVVETPYNLALGQSHVIMFARFLEHSLVASFHFKEGPANTSQAQDARGQQRYKQRDQMRRTKEQQQQMQRVRKSNAIVDWVNGRLEGDVQTLSELRNGVALLQLVYLAYPESFDLARVDFHAKAEYHCEKNLKLLQEVLQKNGVNRDFRIDAVVQAERFNDLFYLATFLHDLVERQLADRGPEDVPSDPVTERRRAEERRKLRFKPFRVAMLAGKSTPRRSIDALDDALSLSEHSQALTTYTTRATSTALSRRMRRRGEELELWVQDVRLPDPGQLDPCVHSPGRRVSPRGEVEALLPPCLDGGPVVAAWPNACDACTLELLPALGHVLYDDITTWPCDAAGTENSAGCAGVTSTHNSPTRAGGDALWCDFDAVLMAAGAS